MTTVELSGLGVTDTNEKWIPIEGLTGRQTYDRLIQTRMKIKDYEPRRAHKTIQKIQKQMTADERNYWWRLTHRTIQAKKRQSKWEKTEDGEFVKSTCPVCKEEEEDWEHNDYGCKWVQVCARDEQVSGGPDGARSTFQQGGVEAGRGEDERKRNADGGRGKMDIPLRTMQD